MSMICRYIYICTGVLGVGVFYSYSFRVASSLVSKTAGYVLHLLLLVINSTGLLLS